MVFRLVPAMGVDSYKTFQVQQPKTERTRIGSCQAAGCPNFEQGWRTIVPTVSEQAAYIRNSSGRQYHEEQSGEFSTFTFHPGQQCFAEHHVPDRPQIFSIRLGDWRADLGGAHCYDRGEQWVEDFAEHQAKLADQLERG